ncbi:MAG: Ku protein [Acidimicrobiales bacterium]
MRAIWSGCVSFGLVNLPVKLYRATAPQTVRFHQLDRRSGARVRNRRVSEKSGREVPYEQIVKGYELDGDQFVIVEPDELETIEPYGPYGPKVIGIEEVVHLDEIDPRQFDRAYWLAPADERASDRNQALDHALAIHTMLFATSWSPRPSRSTA